MLPEQNVRAGSPQMVERFRRATVHLAARYAIIQMLQVGIRVPVVGDTVLVFEEVNELHLIYSATRAA